MKKGLRKLILSGTALAAVAATLGTSTYAWYTTNPTVSASNISSASAATGDSSIYISLDGINFSQSVDFANNGGFASLSALDTANGSNFNTASLNPAQSVSGAFQNLKGTASNASDILTFYLYFKTAKTSANVPVYIKSIALKNNLYSEGAATELSTKLTDNLLNGTDDTDKEDVGVDRTKAQYTVDIANALAMKTSTTTSTYAVKTASGSTTATTNYWDLQSFATTIASTNVSSGQAVNYYNEVMKTTLAADASDLAPTGSPAAKPTANVTNGSRTLVCTLDKDSKICAVRFDVFLNGWDEYCYDACKGQAFTLDLSFTSILDDTAA